MDQFLRLPKSQSRWYGIHPAESKDLARPGKYVNTWPKDVAKLNSVFTRIAKPSASSSQPASCPISQDTLRKWETAVKETTVEPHLSEPHGRHTIRPDNRGVRIDEGN